jgi:alpha-beta hydrolase superfamily lysophospholipase
MIKFTTPSTDGTDLFGRHWPANAPKAVMALIHGFGEHCGRYAHMAAHLNASGIAVVALDLHGHGKTAGKRGVISGYDDFRADVAALLKETARLYPETPQILYGHSMGGGIVLDYGLSNPNSLPIIASAPLITLSQPVPKPLRMIAKIMGKLHSTGAMKQPIDGTKVSGLREEQEAYMADPLNHGTLGFRLAEAMMITGESIAARAAEWDRPLLLLHSKADQLTGFGGSDDFAKAAKQVSFHAFETSQHEMHNDAPRSEIYTLMTDFILKHADPRIS